MTDQQHLDFLAAVGEEFSEALTTSIGWENITPQDGYEVFLRVFRQEPTPQLLARMSDPELERLQNGCKDYFENENITCDQLRTAVTRILARYPAEGTDA